MCSFGDIPENVQTPEGRSDERPPLGEQESGQPRSKVQKALIHSFGSESEQPEPPDSGSSEQAVFGWLEPG